MSYDQRSPTRTGPGSGVWAAQDQEKKSKRLVATMKRPRIEPICFPNSSQRTCGRRATGFVQATHLGKQTYLGAKDRRKTGAQVPARERVPAPCHPALRFSRIIGQLLCVRTA